MNKTTFNPWSCNMKLLQGAVILGAFFLLRKK